ncbi:hypothetical protein SAMN04487911_12249 [Arenibacter nanhaiticus]|uniref:Ferredoxin subunit of nitrite reductase or a ring-hydroxylating dioxygenase n=1 Tax=Arenibacter nanhaiticus TaxID=558155 RepID=A0A1M6JLQ9_9FLAO|nr:hypothetical protein [Arenibacter nanhaiticus]SHJ47659.1 hypothetical protein SAMN04487911_12249 [Arenibacter nanhaiticus]
MKRIFSLILFILILACSNNATNRNPYLQEVSFRFDLNLNLPQYNPLTTTGNSVFIGNSAVGTRGVFVTNVGFNTFRAFEASCPNHVPNQCSTLNQKNTYATNATCPCEAYAYSLFTGQMTNRPQDGNRYYDLLEYRAQYSGNTVIISN